MNSELKKLWLLKPEDKYTHQPMNWTAVIYVNVDNDDDDPQ